MRLKLLLFISLAALVTSCSKNSSVVDDWPGIDEMVLTNEAGSQALSPGDSFTLKSNLNLPRMGKDVSFRIKTDCETNSKASAKKYYKISVYQPEEAKSLKALPVVDIVPEQLIIFPDFFEKCHFALTATNQYKSTETEELLDQKFSFDQEGLDFKVTANINAKYGAISKEDISDFSFKKIKNSPFTNSKLTCLAGTRAETTQISNEATDEIRGDKFTLPAPEKEHPVENCVVQARDTNGKLLISNRVQLLNAKLPPPPQVEIAYTILDENPDEQIFYEDAMETDHHLMTLNITGSTEAYESYRMEEGHDSYIDLDIISDLKLASTTADSAFSYQRYEMNTLKAEGNYRWNDFSRSFSLSKNSALSRSLYLKPKFNCKRIDAPDASKAELGFIISLSEHQSEFNMQRIARNDFTTDVVTTYNLLALAKTEERISNLPTNQNIVNSPSHLSIIFRNNKIAMGIPLEVDHKERLVRLKDNGEPVEKFENFEQYPFMSRTHPHKITCTSQSEFKENK